MKIITFQDIRRKNIDPFTCYEWVSQMIAHKDQTILPPKISMSSRDGVFCNTMPCVLDAKWSGIKVVNRYPDRAPSLDSKLLLLDNSNGDFLALMDGNWITAMRTGAVAAHAIMQFANPDFETVGLIGLGNTCRTTLLVLTSVVKGRKLKIKLLRYKDQAERFMERFAGFENLEFSVVDTYEDLVRGSQVVVSCATYFDHDICPDDCFDEGVLVVPVHTRGFTNCDLFFDKVFADDYGHVHHFKNFDKFKSFAEVCDVVNGRAKGRENPKERILAYNIGIAVHDVNFAAHLHEMFRDDPNVQDVDLLSPDEKFWA